MRTKSAVKNRIFSRNFHPSATKPFHLSNYIFVATLPSRIQDTLLVPPILNKGDDIDPTRVHEFSAYEFPAISDRLRVI